LNISPTEPLLPSAFASNQTILSQSKDYMQVKATA